MPASAPVTTCSSSVRPQAIFQASTPQGVGGYHLREAVNEVPEETERPNTLARARGTRLRGTGLNPTRGDRSPPLRKRDVNPATRGRLADVGHLPPQPSCWGGRRTARAPAREGGRSVQSSAPPLAGTRLPRAGATRPAPHSGLGPRRAQAARSATPAGPAGGSAADQKPGPLGHSRRNPSGLLRPLLRMPAERGAGPEAEAAAEPSGSQV